MTIGDGIAIAGCAWSAAYCLRWFAHGYRNVRVAKSIVGAIKEVGKAVQAQQQSK